MSRGVEWSAVAVQSAFLARRACLARIAAAATMSLLLFIGFPPWIGDRHLGLQPG